MARTADPVAAARAIDDSIRIAAETIGELMEFWNFKPSMGKVWTVLYLCQDPMSAEEIVERTGLSAGSVSMTLNDLQLWGVVHRVRQDGERRRLYAAETDIWAMVTRVFKDRELKLVRRSIQSLTEALTVLEQETLTSDPSVMLRGRFVATRVRQLLDLARTGERLLERLSRSGELDLNPLRSWLDSVRRASLGA
ncbi:MarR family transcriptional regulator [Myxococcota bacterium]|nr:MarR family transcriptional regulator [Myxococcota bacterium]